MSKTHSTPSSKPSKPAKPSADFPLFPHAGGVWAKKINGRTVYFGPWSDPAGALQAFQDLLAGKKREKPVRSPRNPRKPEKPYPEFPLFAHAAGVWAKKIRGQLHYFGVWADPKAALDKYLAEKDDLHAGRKPRIDQGELTVKEAANAFLNAKRELVDAGELSPQTQVDYEKAAVAMVDQFGKRRIVADLRPEDFAALRHKMAKRWGPHGLGKTIQCIRSLFKHAYDAGLLDRPMRFGPGFNRPSKKTLRVHRAKQGPKLFTAEEVRRMIDAANQPLKTMILLAVNCGFGNSDCGHLPLTAVDLDAAAIRYPRPKTGIDRRCPLWPETVQALREALAKRPEPSEPEAAGLVFLTAKGNSWAKDTADAPITKELRKLLDALGIAGKRNFYTLRHVHRTIADEMKDQAAADHIMGHESPHMSTIYRESIGDDRLKAVTDHVRAWLFPLAKTTEVGPADESE